jgi:hypothetical protein
MPRVVPSQVGAFIDTLPSYATVQETVSLNHLGSAALVAILDLVEEIPDELLTMDNASYASFAYAKAQIRDVLDIWIANRNAGHSPLSRQYHVSQDPVALLRRALSQCSDESPAPATSELNFIIDRDLRANLRNDIGAASRALSNGEWKAATVLAGSTIEALLLWDLQNRQTEPVRKAAIGALVAAGPLLQPPPINLERWNLHQFIEVSAQIPTIERETATEARLAKDFRNLIHPGRAQRLGQKCDRGTAHASFAALDHVVRDLTP